MKKVLTVLAVLVLVCASVFAANQMSVRGHVTPLVWMAGFVEGESGAGPMFGEGLCTINADAEFDYYVTDNIRVGAKVDDLFTIGEGDMGNLLFAAFAKAGYVYNIDSKWSVAADLGLGACWYESTPIFAGDVELTGSYSFNDNLSLDFGGQFSFIPLVGGIYAGFGPIVGVEYKF